MPPGTRPGPRSGTCPIRLNSSLVPGSPWMGNPFSKLLPPPPACRRLVRRRVAHGRRVPLPPRLPVGAGDALTLQPVGERGHLLGLQLVAAGFLRALDSVQKGEGELYGEGDGHGESSVSWVALRVQCR